MKELVIVATHTWDTRGGISTALQGFESALTKRGVGWHRVNSHSDKQGRLASWLGALQQSWYHGRRLRSQGVFWLHCGPWLSMLRKLSLALLAKSCGCKVMVHFHSPTLSQYLRSPLKRQLVRSLLACADEVIVLTPWWQRLMAEYFPDVDTIVCANPLAVDVALGASKSVRKTADGGCFRVLSMSRLIPGKGTEHVIQAIARLPAHVVLNIAGDGPMRPELEQLVITLGLTDRVRFLGWLSGEQKQTWLSQSDLFCLPSQYDSFGVVFIEAMAFGLPVIACNWGPISDVVPLNAGALVAYGDVDAIGQQLMRLMQMHHAPLNEIAAITQLRYSADMCIEPVIKVIEA